MARNEYKERLPHMGDAVRQFLDSTPFPAAVWRGRCPSYLRLWVAGGIGIPSDDVLAYFGALSSVGHCSAVRFAKPDREELERSSVSSSSRCLRVRNAIWNGTLSPWCVSLGYNSRRVLLHLDLSKVSQPLGNRFRAWHSWSIGVLHRVG